MNYHRKSLTLYIGSARHLPVVPPDGRAGTGDADDGPGDCKHDVRKPGTRRTGQPGDTPTDRACGTYAINLYRYGKERQES